MKKISHHLPELLLLLIFCFIQLKNINLDFWNDEIYTLKHFTFTSIKNTLTDYHVPNNHILFNLINNLYLKVSNIDSMHSLMNTPYHLRIIPFIYSLLTLFMTYTLSVRFFNRMIGLLTSILIITSIPFFNYALQIRGYELSTLLLILVVFQCFTYLNSPGKKTLLFLSIFTSLLVYTIPSNLYALLPILLIYGIFVFLQSFRAYREENKISSKWILEQPHLHIITAISIGTLIGVACYLPIFKDVFMNQYVQSDAPFEIDKLTYYFSKVTTSIISNRWFILLLSTVGLIITIRKHQNWNANLLLTFAICIVPILIPFFRGDNPPLRVYSIFVPFFCLLFAIGLSTLLSIFIDSESKLNTVFLVLISISALLTFQQELENISKRVLADIKEGNRSQDLYHQYYTHHYQPLKDIEFLKQCYADISPVLIYGCEPHGVINYLDKFGIASLDINNEDLFTESLFANSDSLYLITSKPNSFIATHENKAVFVRQHLTYHTLLKLYKKPDISDLQHKIDHLTATYQDSIRFVFNMIDQNHVSMLEQKRNSYFISYENRKDMGKLTEFINKSRYIGYLETSNRNSININSVIKDNSIDIVDQGMRNVNHFYLVEKKVSAVNYKTSTNTIDFEQPEQIKNAKARIDSNYKYSGQYSEKLDAEYTFSSSITFTLENDIENPVFEALLMSRFEKTTKAMVVLSILREGEMIYWTEKKLANYYTDNDWSRVITTFEVKENLLAGDEVKIYVWNPEKENIWIDNFEYRIN